ncbi:PKD domain-containing protein [Methanospirillum lacunae]|uniref:PKD domain-containing protein n=1 Tax=Methanospirillum lacunae TaxID=668570 RepID=UPI0011B26150|nr:PKD domain-containing protein [Methanospirillum lacunae]
MVRTKRRVEVLAVLILLCFIPLIGVADRGFSSQMDAPKILFQSDTTAVSTSAHSAMIAHPSLDQRKQWNSEYLNAPLASVKNSDLKKDLSDSSTMSLLSYITYNATERDQQNCGNGWVWVGTSALEVAHSTQNGVNDRLSVQYLNSKYHNGGKSPYSSSDCACNGGNPGNFVDFYMLSGKYGGNKTVIPWNNTNAAFFDGNVTSTGHSNIDSSLINLTPSYKLTSLDVSRVETLNIPQDSAIKNIKRLLENGKPVMLTFYLPDQNAWNEFDRFWDYGLQDASYFDIDTYAGSTYTSTGGSHMVLVTGYTDNGTAGYWQCLNSWGTSAYRPNGTFYINEYMDYSATYLDYGESLPVTQWETLDTVYNTTVQNITPIDNPNLIADFIVSPESGYPPLNVHFADNSSGGPDSWKWNFGDGGGSIISSPNHTYTQPGHYSISLSIGKSGYSAGTIKENAVTVKFPYVTVSPFPKPDGGNYSVPTDPDGDGRYEDINGNGWLENDDPIVYLKNLQFAQKNEPVTQFDFDGSGFIGYGDIVMLKKMV